MANGRSPLGEETTVSRGILVYLYVVLITAHGKSVITALKKGNLNEITYHGCSWG